MTPETDSISPRTGAPKIDAIELGVNDIDCAAQFCERGLGGTIATEDQAVVVSFGAGASPLVLRPWNAVAGDAGADGRSDGFRAFTLSYIVESADQVDQILSRAEAHGGTISKPPKSAVWGYSAYVTDPSGHLWKIASTKRRPLLGLKAAAHSGRPIRPQELPITVGVADVKRAKQFYKDGLGLPVKKSFGSKFVMFDGRRASDLALYTRKALANDAAVPPDGSGFRGFALTYVVDSTHSAEELLARAGRAGGRPIEAGGDRVRGCFADLDGNLWQVAVGG
jgi:catechol 2,3-dioxygenase-like lactoylglutathione lyase family enzyme